MDSKDMKGKVFLNGKFVEYELPEKSKKELAAMYEELGLNETTEVIRCI